MSKNISKFFAIIMVLVLNLSLIACSSSSSNDSSDSLTSAVQLVGKWYLRSDGTNQFTGQRQYMLLNANGTYSIYPTNNPYGIKDRGTWKLEGMTIVLNNNAANAFTVTNYTLNGLTLQSGKFTFTFERTEVPAAATILSNATARQLIGKWVLTTQTFLYEDTRTFNDPRMYITFNEDGTFITGNRRLFEAEKTGGKWAMKDNNTIIFNNDDSDTYKILEISATSLQLGWIEEGDVIEWSTFRKAQ
ncbi:MAG: lipocalin family protein [Prevotella sp.]|nr:lipocalin family protein [Prevotella sp.]